MKFTANYKNIDLIKTIVFVNNLLKKSHKIRALKVILIILFSAFIEVLALAVFFPIIALTKSKASVENPGIIKDIYAWFHFQDYNAFIFSVFLTLFFIYLLKNLIVVFVTNYQMKFAFDVGYDISKRQMEYYLNKDYLFFTRNKSSEIVKNIYVLPHRFSQGTMVGVINMVSETIVITFILVSIILFNYKIFIIMSFSLIPATFILYSALKKKNVKIGQNIDTFGPICYANVQQTIMGFTDITLMNKTQYFVDDYLHNFKIFMTAVRKAFFYNTFPGKIIETVAFMGLVILSFTSMVLKLNSDFITIIGLFAIAAYRIMPSITRLIIATNAIKTTQYTYNLLQPLIHSSHQLNNSEKIPPFLFENFIELKNISFFYDDDKVIDNFSLRVSKGEKIGIVGESGSGKTTLMNIFLRFLIEKQGQFIVDGKEVKGEKIKGWHQNIGYVKQDSYIFDSTVAKNIAVGEILTQENRDNVWKALEKASLDTFVKTLPMGIDTELGERGIKISGGQKQRIGIARAFYKEPSILFLDEATSALDNETEIEIAKSIDELMHTNITIVIIAHRYTTLQSCDRIIELKNGKLLGEYSYSDIAARYV